MNSTAGKPCTTCNGSGMVTVGQSAQKCPMCEGSGKQFDPGRFFTYELGPIILAGAQSLQFQSVQVLNYRFRWILAAAQQLFNFTAQVQDSRDQRPFSNQQVHNLNLFGTAQHPLPVLTPFEFEKNSQIQVNITDLGGGSGTAGFTNGSGAVTSVTGTGFATDGTWTGKTLVVGGVSYTITAVADNADLTISPVFAGVTGTHAYAVNNSVRLAFIGVELEN